MIRVFVSRNKKIGFLILFLLAGQKSSGQTSQNAENSKNDLAQVSIEDLMDTEIVSVSKKEQKLSETPAAVFVISKNDIRNSGANNIPDLLRMVPGVDVAQMDANTWAIGTRGLNQQFSNKLLILVDGRNVYDSSFGGVLWDGLDIPLEDIERIEVIRGPGGTIWGANAVNGVINIFTKTAADTPGTMVEAGGGTLDQGFGTVQYGGKFKKWTDYRIYTKYLNEDHLPSITGQNGYDGWHLLRVGFRSDSVISSNNTLTLEGDIYAGKEGILGHEVQSVTDPVTRVGVQPSNRGDGSFQVVWNHAYSSDSDGTLEAYFDRHEYQIESRNTWALDYHHHLRWGPRQEIVWGMGYEYTSDDTIPTLTVSFNPPSRVLQFFNGFAQDEIKLVPDRLFLTVGTKLEHNDYTGLEVMPSVRMTWIPGDHHTFWTAISRALRTPARNDTNLSVNLGTVPGPGGNLLLLRLLGNPQLKNESLLAYEAGYRTTISDRLSIDVAAYFNSYGSLKTTETSPPFFEFAPSPPHLVLPMEFGNLMDGETHGIEIATNWKILSSWTVSPSYAFERIHIDTKATSNDTTSALFLEGGAPHHSAQLRSHFDLHKNWTWDTSIYFVDRLTHQSPTANQIIPAYTRLDTQLTWKPSERASFSLVGQNLLKDHHLEFEDLNGSVQSGQMKRSAYLKAVYYF